MVGTLPTAQMRVRALCISALLCCVAAKSVSCPGSNYPTTWNIINRGSKKVYVGCRVYYGYSSFLSRELNFVVDAKSSKEIRFGDHNDGLGMLSRNFACAESRSPAPLTQAKSRGFLFFGCSGQRMKVGKKSSIRVKRGKARGSGQRVYCPDPSKLKKLNKCTGSLCAWDHYGVDDWEGTYNNVPETLVKRAKFVGVDALPDGLKVLGCVYRVPGQDRALSIWGGKVINLPASSSRKYRYAGYSSRTFTKVVGKFKMCLSSRIKDCPLKKV